MNDQDHLRPFATPVHRDLEAPLYAQIQRDIEISIATNRLRPGDLVPGEIELASRYSVSRVTVRQALGELVAEGLLYRIQGKGTFVAAPMIQRAEPNVTSFFFEMLESGRKSTSQAISEVCKPDRETVRILKLSPGERVIVTRRLRLVDGEPIAYQINTTRRSLCPGLEKEDLSNQSFQYILEVKYGVRIVGADEVLTSILSNRELAEHLRIPMNVAILMDSRVHYGADKVLIGRSCAYFRGDRYTYKIARTLAAGN